MVVMSVLLGSVSLIVGFGIALMSPVPPGDAVALTASLLFILSLLVPWEGILRGAKG